LPDGPARVELRGWGWRHAGRKQWALRGVDLVIEPGERVLLLGPSGAGKSTLLAALAGLHDPETAGESEGILLVDGQPAREVRAQTGLVLQDPETQIVMARAGDDVAFGLENRAWPRELIWAQVARSLTTVGFPYGMDRSTSELSGGEKQRLAIAGVLALGPGLLLLDEPTANLDPRAAELVEPLIGAASGRTRVVTSHDPVGGLHGADVALGLRGGRAELLAPAPGVGREAIGALYR
jgi:energy-coupling factor transport system ATP-binding protein